MMAFKEACFSGCHSVAQRRNLRFARTAVSLRGLAEPQIPCGNDNKKDESRPKETILTGKHVSYISAACLLLVSVTVQAETSIYVPPKSSAPVLHGVDFAAAQLIAPELTQLYQDCDQQTTRGGCNTDPAHNTVILKFGDTASLPGPVFFDAKMAIDADGSALSKKAEHPNQPETALRYPVSLQSLDAERVPYIVMPMGGFRQASGVVLGDLAAVVKDGQVHFAIVGDIGPRTHIGEASMYLHTLFGRKICQAHDDAGNCSHLLDTSLDAPVLYFLFPDTKKLIFDSSKDSLAPENINERLVTIGQQVWRDFLNRQQGSKE